MNAQPGTTHKTNVIVSSFKKHLVTMATVHCLLLLALVPFATAVPQIQHEYHNYEQLTSLMSSLADAYPSKTHLYSIGTSVQNRELWVMAISNSKPDDIVPRRPDVKYVGNMHGNEVIGREVLLQLIEHLLVNSDSDPAVKQLLDDTRVHVLPSMNPDGFEVAVEGECTGNLGRGNANGLDLNRNFPDFFEPNDEEIQPETRAIMDWVQSNQFVLSANLHGGALLANYPFDNMKPEDKPATGGAAYSESPDDAFFRKISLAYSLNHPRMHLVEENRCFSNDSNDGFPDGITNGGEWYLVKGGMQDYNYIFAGCPEITLEIACCKYPAASTLSTHWDENRPALLAYLQQSHRGVKGVVRDRYSSEPVEGALVSIVGQASPPNPASTTKMGEYWKLLLNGTYEVQISKPGYTTESKSVTVLDSVDPGDVVILDVLLNAASLGASPSGVVMATLLVAGKLSLF
ncbi:carboxypeptidase D-like [Patiria miniata]|uniref:Peptidase M14 domain-containing protein n=1 Tax=Patiria miniata TaxID=46514 RepID=A0A914A177_PATMI|nr:carboxypeptidase D-like [Patiria miniata]